MLSRAFELVFGSRNSRAARPEVSGGEGGGGTLINVGGRSVRLVDSAVRLQQAFHSIKLLKAK